MYSCPAQWLHHTWAATHHAPFRPASMNLRIACDRDGAGRVGPPHRNNTPARSALRTQPCAGVLKPPLTGSPLPSQIRPVGRDAGSKAPARDLVCPHVRRAGASSLRRYGRSEPCQPLPPPCSSLPLASLSLDGRWSGSGPIMRINSG
jgi:hypothetical protein